MIRHESATKNGHKLVVKEAEPAEAGLVLEFINRVAGQTDYLSFGLNELEITEEDEEKFLSNCLESSNQLFLVGWISDSVVSTLSFHGGQRPRLRHTGEFGMSVDKEFWSQGIGSIMVDILIDWATHHDEIMKINLRVRTDNIRAIELYKRKGFQHEGTIRKELCINGEYFDHHWMGLDLS